MPVTTTELFLAAMLVIFTVPWLAWRLLRTDRIAPLVVVQIVGGILLGPGVLGAAFPQAYQTVFTPDVITALNGIAWWAVMIFVFIAGVELDLGHAREYLRVGVLDRAGDEAGDVADLLAAQREDVECEGDVGAGLVVPAVEGEGRLAVCLNFDRLPLPDPVERVLAQEDREL